MALSRCSLIKFKQGTDVAVMPLSCKAVLISHHGKWPSTSVSMACTVSVAQRANSFLSHSTCWVADDLRWPGFKSRSGRKFSVGRSDARYAMRLISRTDTNVRPCPLQTVTGAASEVTTLQRDRNVHIIIIRLLEMHAHN